VVLPDGDALREGESGGEAPAKAPSREASGAAGEPARSRFPVAGSSAAPAYEPAVVACAVLDVMIDFLGDALTRSRERGTVLSDHGPAIVAVWEEYRRRAGAEAPAAEFRVALKDRLGVDLSPRGTG